MSIETHLPFYGSLLPSLSIEARCTNKDVYKNNLKVLELFLKLAAEIADCVEQYQYTKFDALVGNFGCQITALEVQQILLKQDSLSQDVTRLKEVLPEKLELLQSVIKKTSTAVIKSCQGLNLGEIIAQNELDFEISPSISKLIRFRLLGIVNHNELKEGVEVPCTKYTKLQSFTTLSIKQIQCLVDRIQSEESKMAARYLIDQSERLDCERAPLIKQAVNPLQIQPARTKSKPIELLPNMHNTEACLRLIQGTVLVKNKLKRCGADIVDAKPLKIWLEIASNKILKKEEVSELKCDQPVVIIEGYVKASKKELKVLIRDPGIIPIVNASCAKLQPQYSGWDIKETFDLPEEVLQDIEQYAAFDEGLSAFETDHIYCASVKEERDE